MFSLSDFFAFMYGMDLQSLDLVLSEASRIRGERECNSAPEAPRESVPVSLPVKSH